MKRIALVQKILLPFYFILFLFSSSQIAAQNTEFSNAWLKVISNLQQYYVVIDQDFEHPHLINRGDSIKVAPGSRHITIVWETVNDKTFTINAKAGKTIDRQIFHAFPTNPRSSYKTIVSQTNLIITTDPNSSIYMDGKYLGKGDAQVLRKPGAYKLLIKHPTFGSLKKKISVNTFHVKYIERYNRDPEPGIEVFNFIPAGGYIQNRQSIKTAITYVSFGAGITALIYLNNSYKKHDNNRMEFIDQYSEASTIKDAVFFRIMAEREIEEIEQINNTMKNIGIGMIALYVLTTLDGMRKPRDGYKKTSNLNTKFSLQSLQTNGNIYPSFSIYFPID